MENARLIVCDIDNTLVVKHEPLTERARNVILELQRRGVLFGLASGRSVPQLHDLEERWNIKADLLIGLNGGDIYDGISNYTKVVYQMEPDWIRQSLDLMRQFPECNPSMFKNGMHLCRFIDQTIMNSAKYLGKDPKDLCHIVEDEYEFYNEATDKIGFRTPAEIMPEVEKAVAAYHFEGFKPVKTENTMMEFCNANASKGALLEMFCKDHDIDMKNVYAFGDMTNDISMLEVCQGVCMVNGSDDAKAVSKYITDFGVKEDGFAKWVEKNFLGKGETTMDALECLLTRRSVRSYTDQPVEKEKLQKIVEAGMYAASAQGKQPGLMLVVQDPDTLEKLRRLNCTAVGNEYTRDNFYGAKTVIVVLAEKERPARVYDGSLIMGNLMNAAHALGLGSCWIHRAKETFETEEGKQLLADLGVEGEYEGIGNLIVGYTNGDYPVAKERKANFVIWK